MGDVIACCRQGAKALPATAAGGAFQGTTWHKVDPTVPLAPNAMGGRHVVVDRLRVGEARHGQRALLDADGAEAQRELALDDRHEPHDRENEIAKVISSAIVVAQAVPVSISLSIVMVIVMLTATGTVILLPTVTVMVLVPATVMAMMTGRGGGCDGNCCSDSGSRGCSDRSSAGKGEREALP